MNERIIRLPRIMRKHEKEYLILTIKNLWILLLFEGKFVEIPRLLKMCFDEIVIINIH